METFTPQSISQIQAFSKSEKSQYLMLLGEKLVALGYHPAIAAVNNDLESAAVDSEPLSGVPYGVKDLFDIQGYPTTASSRFLAEIRPVNRSSAVVGALSRLGAVWAAKTHLNEFAYGLSGENTHYGDCPHPVLSDCLSGGSSSGSAWMVGAGLVPFSIGTDTGGSIRVPSSFCGLFGLRLTPDHPWSRDCVPLAPSFDTIGFMTRLSEDMQILVEELLEKSGSEIDSAGSVAILPEINYSEGVLETYQQVISSLGVEVDEEYSLEYNSLCRDAVKAFNILQSTEALGVHADWLEKYGGKYDPSSLAKIKRAENWTADEKSWAKSCQHEILTWFSKVFNRHDVLILPAVHSPAVSKDSLNDAFRGELLALTTAVSLAGLPVLNLPIQLPKGKTVGLQVVTNGLQPSIYKTYLEKHRKVFTPDR